MKFMVFILFIMASTVGPLAQIVNLDWSFVEHPDPYVSGYTAEEFRFLDKVSSASPDNGVCEAGTRARFKIYRDRYPDFEKSGEPMANYRNWKLNFAEILGKDFTGCLIISPMIKFFNLQKPRYNPGMYYCGKISGPPQSDRHKEMSAIAEELMAFAGIGNWHAIDTILFLNHLGERFIDLNTDVEYFLRKSLPVDWEFDKRNKDTSNLEPLLDAERRAFVDAALERSDLQAVLDTTAPCPKRE